MDSSFRVTHIAWTTPSELPTVSTTLLLILSLRDLRDEINYTRIMGNPDPSGIRNPTSLSCDAYDYTRERYVDGFKPLLQEYYPFRRDEITNIYEFQPEDKVILVGHSNGEKKPNVKVQMINLQ